MQLQQLKVEEMNYWANFYGTHLNKQEIVTSDRKILVTDRDFEFFFLFL